MSGKRINLNNASKEELSSLPMMGETRAQYVIERRPYKDWDDFKNKVPSISETMLDDLKKGGAEV